MLMKSRPPGFPFIHSKGVQVRRHHQDIAEATSGAGIGCIHKMALYVVFICFNGENDDKFPVGSLKEVDLALFNDFSSAGKL